MIINLHKNNKDKYQRLLMNIPFYKLQMSSKYYKVEKNGKFIMF